MNRVAVMSRSAFTHTHAHTHPLTDTVVDAGGQDQRDVQEHEAAGLDGRADGGARIPLAFLHRTHTPTPSSPSALLHSTHTLLKVPDYKNETIDPVRLKSIEEYIATQAAAIKHLETTLARDQRDVSIILANKKN